MDGLTLRDLVRDDGPLPASSVRTLAVDLARLLAASGTAHGTLSPDTIRLTPDGPRLAEGSAPDPAYMSPEQAREHDLVPPADIFALGAVLAYAATGRNPFGEGPHELLAYRIAYHVPDLDGLPDDLQDLIKSCLSKTPSARPTATDLAPAPPSAADPREALLTQLAGSMQAVLTNSATMFATLRDRRPTPAAARPRSPSPAPEPGAPTSTAASRPGTGTTRT
ncbi:protein kinase [Spirillospora sp. NPDC049652]